jgi:hypothetical protein
MLAPLTHRGPIKTSLVRVIPSPERLHNQSVNVLRKVDLSSLPIPWDRVDLSPDSGLIYTGLLNVQLV